MDTTTSILAKNVTKSNKEWTDLVEEKKAALPIDHIPYTDKYFIRTKQVLIQDNHNPWVRYQIFSRGEQIRVHGINEAIAIIDKYTPLRAHGGQIWVIPENSLINQSDSKEPLMIIEGPLQDLVELETMYLGAISAGCSPPIDLIGLKESAKEIVKAAQGKPVIYFGARHFHYSLDSRISSICHEAGFVGTSTDVGAKHWGAVGGGSMPHASILAYGSTLEASVKFDKYIDPNVARVVLIDTWNKEIDDTLAVAEALGQRLAGVRIDTCGESISQGAADVPASELEGLSLKYKNCNGVSIAAVWALRKALLNANRGDVEIWVSSGFNARKTAAFIEADKKFQSQYKEPLFHAIGSGSLGANIRIATSDIVSILDEEKKVWIPRSKVGRGYLESSRLMPYYPENLQNNFPGG